MDPHCSCESPITKEVAWGDQFGKKDHVFLYSRGALLDGRYVDVIQERLGNDSVLPRSSRARVSRVSDGLPPMAKACEHSEGPLPISLRLTCSRWNGNLGCWMMLRLDLRGSGARKR